MAVDLTSVSQMQAEFRDLTEEFRILQDEKYVEYSKKATELITVRSKCKSMLDHQKKRIATIESSIKKFGKKELSDEERSICQGIKVDLEERKKKINELQLILPKSNGLLLTLILGHLNLTLIDLEDRYHYKDEYETFKLYVTSFFLALLIINQLFVGSIIMDHLIHFILVWYYCTVTIREHILRLNGSKIKGWWVIHHYLSAILSCILLVCPINKRYNQYRDKFNFFASCIGVVQILQYYYQRGCLYRLRSLGETDKMMVTVEGFRSYMWRGLSFLLPFLLSVYMLELYNAYILYHISIDPECHEWQFPALSLMFLTLACGNIYTTVDVVRTKLITQKSSKKD